MVHEQVKRLSNRAEVRHVRIEDEETSCAIAITRTQNVEYYIRQRRRAQVDRARELTAARWWISLQSERNSREHQGVNVIRELVGQVRRDDRVTRQWKMRTVPVDGSDRQDHDSVLDAIAVVRRRRFFYAHQFSRPSRANRVSLAEPTQPRLGTSGSSSGRCRRRFKKSSLLTQPKPASHGDHRSSFG